MTAGSDGPKVRIDKSFKKRLARKPPKMRAAVLECIDRVVDDPSHPGLNTHPVVTAPGVLSSRVDGANRLTWRRVDGVIELLNHCNHDLVYRKPRG